MSVVYCIRNIISNRRYIGGTIDIKKRIVFHEYYLNKKIRNVKATNRHLYDDVQKYGWNKFVIEILETFQLTDRKYIYQRELYWIYHYNTIDRKCGYNLRRDTSSGMIVHDETRIIQSNNVRGSDNPNYGNNWSESSKLRMSEIKKGQHAEGIIYDELWRKGQGERSAKFWKNNPDKLASMAAKMVEKKKKYDFLQLNEDGSLVRRWSSMDEIINENPEYKWQNIYSVCNGYKKRIYGYKWEKVLKT